MIRCEIHDYVEIVCTYRYPILLKLKSGEIKEGFAADTCYDPNRNECIKLDINDGQHLIVLDDIAEMEVTVKNPHLDKIAFK